MTISIGARLPNAQLTRMGAKGPENMPVSTWTRGHNVVIFGVVGAYTPTCSGIHVPGFIRAKPALMEKGVETIICVSVNDAAAMAAWGEATGAAAAGIVMMDDPEGAFTRALGLACESGPDQLIGRSKRYALYAEDGVVKVLHVEQSLGVCMIAGGAAMLAVL